MIHHLSIAARDPKHVGGVLAELMGGVAVPFPHNPGSYFALQLDEHGSGVDVYPAGTELQPGGSSGAGFVEKPEIARRYGPTHFALSVPTAADTIEAIARRVGVVGGDATFEVADDGHVRVEIGGGTQGRYDRVARLDVLEHVLLGLFDRIG